MADNLRERLLESATLASPEESELFFEETGGADSRYWGDILKGGDSPTGQPIIHINRKKFQRHLGQKELTPDQEQTIRLGESLHNLREVDPEAYNSLFRSAMSNPDFVRWVKDSYENVAVPGGEKRSFDDWLRTSRFDQIIGGWLFAGDPTYPSLKNWPKWHSGYRGGFGKQLEGLRKRLRLPSRTHSRANFVDRPLYNRAE